MFHVSYKNVNFDINLEKKTVVCWIDGGQELKRMAIDFAEEHGLSQFLQGQRYSNINRWLLNPHYFAKATCSPDDEWNEELGKRIAYNRLKNKIGYAFFNRIQKIYDHNTQVLENFANDANKYGIALEEESHAREERISAELNV